MKKLSILLLVVLGSISLNILAQDTEKASDQVIDETVVEVYYFHLTRRCATCQAVENESEAALQKLYPEELRSGKIIFMSVNLEEESNEALAEKLDVSGQSLLVVKGDKMVNLTNDGFKYARSNPEKLEASLKDAIDPIL